MTTQTPAAGANQGLSLAEKVIQHVKLTDFALEKAASAEKQATEKQAQVAAIIPRVVDAMVQHERIFPAQREKLAEMLKDPAAALELMIKLAGHRNPEEAAKLGSGVPANGQTKQAGVANYDPASSLTDPNVGARTTRVKQSSMKLFAGLGLATPQQ